MPGKIDVARAAQSNPVADELGLAEPAGTTTVDPAVGRRPQTEPPTDATPTHKVVVRRITAGSVGWDDDAIKRLRRLASDETGLTRRSVHNVLLARFLALPKKEQREIIDAALAWEREMRP